MSHKKRHLRGGLDGDTLGGRETHWVVRYEPRNQAQRELREAWNERGVDMIWAIGAVGSGKTVGVVGEALGEIWRGKTGKATLYVVRPPVEAGNARVGFLPGGLDEKLAPYGAPVDNAVAKVSSGKPPEGTIKTMSLAHARGWTFEDCVVVVDEAQNLVEAEIKLLVGRIGNNCKMVFCGDPEQLDVTPTRADGVAHLSDMDWAADRLNEEEGVVVIDFRESDIVRHPRLGRWMRALR